MAIYRSDQAQFSFAVEAAPGGYPELATAAGVTNGTGSAAIDLAAGQPAGSRSLTVDALSGIVADEYIRIGTSDTANSEVRRVVFVEGTTGLVVDTPTGFFHANNTVVQVVTAVSDVDNNKYITFVPGVYETVEVPDPEQAIEPRYYLGTASKRNPYQYLKGQQTYAGSLGGFVLLDGRALRFPIGKVTSIPMESNGVTHAIGATAITINQSGTYAYPHKGDTWITLSGSHGIVAEDYMVIYGAASASSAEAIATAEVRKARAVSTNAIQLDAPLQFDHAHADYVREVDTSSLDHYKHTILETVDLDSVSWHLHVRDSSETDANDFDRRYHGGKIGNISLSAEEGGLLTCGWDGVNFLGMNHNQKAHSGFTGDLPFYTLMQPIRNADVAPPGTISTTTTAEPYYFSQGQVTLFGSIIARVRSFSLSVNNNEEPRYYLRRTMGRHRGPSEILEQRREYTCSVTLALPDATTNTSTAISIFKELLLEGDYGAGMKGFNIVLQFDRGTNDSIVITIPDDGAAGVGGNEQGAFINTAPHAISEANPMEVEAEVLFRNLTIVVKDNIAVYP